jgi:hypothetical protein
MEDDDQEDDDLWIVVGREANSRSADPDLSLYS